MCSQKLEMLACRKSVPGAAAAVIMQLNPDILKVINNNNVHCLHAIYGIITIIRVAMKSHNFVFILCFLLCSFVRMRKF